MSQLQEHDIQRGTTSVGPHRDDWEIQLNQRSLAPFGSRGQQRSAILALKIAEIEWMKHNTQEHPILLLDEVVAELDNNRRTSLLETILQSNQAIVTATEPNMFSNQFLQMAHCFQIKNGQIHSSSVFDQNANFTSSA
jgi:DNA replication and repair protein RecF